MLVGRLASVKTYRNITNDDLAAAARLSKLWDREQRARKFTQDTAADDLGWSQGMISQYLRGHTALGLEATLKFAKFLGVSPSEIRADYDHLVAINKVAEALSEDEYGVAALWSKIPDGPTKDGLYQLLESLAETKPK